MARASKNTITKTAAAALELQALASAEQILDLDDLVNQIDVAILETLPEEVVSPEISELTQEDLHILDAKSLSLESQAPDMSQIIEVQTQPEEVQAFVGISGVEAFVGISGVEAYDPATLPEMPSLGDIVDMFDKPRREAMRAELVTALDAREEYEVFEKANDKILKSLRKCREKLANTTIASMFLATNTDPAIFNRHKVSSNRYNIYAIPKVGDLMTALLNGTQPTIDTLRVVVASLYRFRDASVPFTMETAKDAVSCHRRVSAVTAKHLVRHTVGLSTASTQASSSMQAIESLGMLTKTGTGKSATYALVDTPQTRRMEEIMKLV